MNLSDDQIKMLLEWFVAESDSYKKWSSIRRAGLETAHQWIQPEVINSLNDTELKERFIGYYKNGSGDKQSLNQLNRDRIVRDMGAFRRTLLFLLDESIEIENRINQVLQGDFKIEGFGKAITTAMLMDLNPEKYCLWNNKTEAGLSQIGIQIESQGKSIGNNYVQFLQTLQKLRNLKPELRLSNLDIDFFFHVISAENEGVRKLQMLTGEASPGNSSSADEFGYRTGSLTSRFCLAIKEKPLTMKEVEALGLSTHPKAFKKLRKLGLAKRDEKGRMYIVGSKAEQILKSEEPSYKIRDSFLTIMDTYILAKTDETARTNLRNVFDNLILLFQQLTPIFKYADLKVKYSIGMGHMANIPWIALMDSRETNTTQRGIYCVYLFKADMSGVYFTLNQGVGKTEKGGPTKAELDIVHTNAINLRKTFNWSEGYGFKIDDEIKLVDPGSTGMAYEKSTIAYKYYDRNLFPADAEIENDLNILLNGYMQFINKPSSKESKSWIFQANPKIYDIESALKVLKEISWSVRQHKDAIRSGDTVYIWQSGSNAAIVAVGTVGSNPQKVKNDEREKPFIINPGAFPDEELRVHVRIDLVLESSLKKEFLVNHPLLTNLTLFKAAQGTNFSLTAEQASALDQLIANKTTVITPMIEAYSKDAACKDLFISEQEFDYALNRLRYKKNIILQGPPGVGKTFIAKRLAYCLMGSKDNNRLSMIQFHQSYSYEDFVQGFRPNEDGKFTLRNGLFYEFCRQATKDPDKKYIFIIDEINRGNLSKIFGEMLMLIEADKRGQQFAVPLTYGKGNSDTFYIPENLYLIGTMNTADRSLAMVDYALRRRFSFIDLKPEFKNTKFRQILIDAGIKENLINLIVDRIQALNKTISEDTKNLGPGYCIGHSYFCATVNDQPYDEAWYRMVIKSEIEPLVVVNK